MRIARLAFIVALFFSSFIFSGCAAIGERANSEGNPKRAPKYDRPGYEAFIENERLWVLVPGTAAWSNFIKLGEPTISATWIGEGPEGMTLRGADEDSLLGYVGQTAGFKAIPQKGVLYVFRDPSEALDKFEDFNRLEPRIEAKEAGPHAATLVSNDQATIDAYLAAR